MKKIIALIGILPAFAVVATAQNQQNQQNQTCRDISAGGYIGPDEVIMQTQSGYVACRVFKLLPAAAKSEPAPAPVTATAPAPTPVPTPVPAAIAGFGVLGASNFGQSRVAKVQVATGYQYNSVNFSGYGYYTSRVNTSGVFVQLMMNLNRYVSPVVNVDISYKYVYGSNYLLTYLGGVQTYPLSHRQWSPFGRMMVGAGTLHTSGAGAGVATSATGFAWQVGGGLDWRPRRESRMALRLGTFDFARVSKYGINANSLKIGTGIVF